MKITLDNVDYNLNVEAAMKLGVLTQVPKTRPIYVTDIPNGSAFRWKDGMFVMRNNTATSPKQCIQVCGDGIDDPEQTWFDHSTALSYWDEKQELWISEVENG